MTPKESQWIAPAMFDWLQAASRLPGKSSVQMAITVLGLSLKLCRTQHILLTPQLLKKHGIPRSSSSRALEQMENAGLIEIRRQRGTHPLVSIRWPPALASGNQEGD